MISIREARPDDAQMLVGMIALLGHQTTASGVKARLESASSNDLVAVDGGTVIGLCGLATAIHIHRERPVGRITILVVAADARGRGIGKMLVEEAERFLLGADCGLIEITSNDRLTEAHRFYRHMGYEQTSQRFVKTL